MLWAAMQEPGSANPQRVIKRVACKQQDTPSLFLFLSWPPTALADICFLSALIEIIFCIKQVYFEIKSMTK